MNKLSLILHKGAAKLVRNSPDILTVLGVTGVITTTTLAIRATGPALAAIDQSAANWYNWYPAQMASEDVPEIPLLEYYKPAFRFYIPTVISGVLTIACIIGASKIRADRLAAVAALYSLTEKELVRYQEKVIEEVGKNKAGKIQEAMAEGRLAENPLISEDQIFATGRGQDLFFDALSGRYFRSNSEFVRSMVNEFNQTMINGDMYKTLNEFYADLGLEPIELGRQMGWDVDHLLEVTFTAKLTQAVYVNSTTPCIVMEYRVNPHML